MSGGRRHISWDEFRQQVLDPRVPARLAVGSTPPVWIAFNDGTLSLSTPVAASSKVPISPLRAVEVANALAPEGLSVLQIWTSREDLYREFFFLGLSIVDMIQADATPPFDAFSGALSTWKELLQSASRMSPEQELGLIGELWLLERLFLARGPDVLDAWTGPRREPHDFRIGKTEFEVKSTRSTTRIHVIHGIKQLVPSLNCQLYVLSLQWEPAGSTGGRTLPAQIEAVRALLGESPELLLFNELLRTHLHYHDDDAPLYSDRFRLRTEPALVKVTPEFPRIIPETIADTLGDIAARVSDVSYRINLEGLGHLESSRPFRKLLPGGSS